MTSDRALAAKLAHLAQTEAADVVRPTAQATGTDTVESVSGDRCSLTAAGPNFRVAGGLSVVAGDLVAFTRRGTDRHVLAVIGRNAVDIPPGGLANPLTASGQIIIGGDGGTPTTINPPDSPTDTYTMRWGGDVQRPGWQDTSIDPPPPTAMALAASSSVGATNIKVTVVSGWSVGTWLLIDTDVTQITTVGTAGSGGTGFDVSPALPHAHASGAPIAATSAPPPPPPPPGGFPPMTMWWPYWKSRSLAQVSDIADDMVYMGQGGVVLMGMQWGSDYSLPSDVSAKLDIFIAKGIKPYLGLWVGHLTTPDRTVGQAAFDAGDDKWAGIVLDAETQWVNHCKPVASGGVGAVQAKADFDGFMAIFRPLTDQLAVACYASPTSYPNYHYDWWNEVVDTFLPTAYFNSPTDTADAILNTMYRKFATAAADWTSAPKPIIPVMSGYKADMTDAMVAERLLYINRALTDAGAVHIWRWTDTFPDNLRAMLHAV